MAIRFLSTSFLVFLGAIGFANAQAVGTCPGGVSPTFAGCLPAIVTPLAPTDGINVLQGGRPAAIWGVAGINQLLATPTPLNPTTLSASALPTTCSGQPAGNVANIGGILNAC